MPRVLAAGGVRQPRRERAPILLRTFEGQRHGRVELVEPADAGVGALEGPEAQEVEPRQERVARTLRLAVVAGVAEAVGHPLPVGEDSQEVKRFCRSSNSFMGFQRLSVLSGFQRFSVLMALVGLW